MTESEFVELIHSSRFQTLWHGLARVMWKYFRVEVEGLENLPQTGSAIIAPNHSGFAGADAILLSHLIHKKTGSLPRTLAYRTYFEWFNLIKLISESFGMRQANLENGLQSLREGKHLLLFPEGEQGNFKPSRMLYCLQEFHGGFVRMAIKSKAPIILCLVIGAEESHLNFGHLDFTRWVPGLKVPLPINLLPMPAKWKIRFLEPISLAHHEPWESEDRASVTRISKDLHTRMQNALNEELRKRPYVYIPKPKWLRI